ncbi:bacteriocin immunity protein [Pseudomonas sp. SDI]|uniref:bacteriocin immunity protein n=1 Tax=Pseudomonas sp. SDI TaxID=2170734 RepID=UPI000DE75059|nr:bacteriocin immunity protein [Pseudomonas sp. SDI]PWB35954.1 bacteriocin immunity protein [Pseudomonas sp. SDI]
MEKSISDYTEAQFIHFVEELFAANDNGASDEVLGDLLDQFRRISEHPDGTDLIYYPEDGADDSAEGITNTIKKWREANGLPGFKAGS